MLDSIIDHLPRDRQIMLYSATFPLTVESFMVSCFIKVHVCQMRLLALMRILVLISIAHYYQTSLD